MAIDAPVIGAMLVCKRAPLVIPENARYNPTDVEQNRLELYEATKVLLEEEEKKIHATADAALASLGSMVEILFVTTVAATALAALHDQKTPVLVSTLAAVFSMVAFSGGIFQGIWVTKQKLHQLKWPNKVIALKRSLCCRELVQLSQDFVDRGIYIDADHFRNMSSHESIRPGHDQIMNDLFGLRFRCLLSFSGQSYHWTKPYKRMMISYGIISMVLVIGNVVAGVLALSGTRT